MMTFQRRKGCAAHQVAVERGERAAIGLFTSALRGGCALSHLSSTSLTLISAGARLNTNTELRHHPYGVVRYTAGATPTSFNFTGQRAATFARTKKPPRPDEPAGVALDA